MDRYVLRGGQPGFDRLRLLARVHQAETAELLRLAGVRPGLRCIDLGCGSGDVTFELAGMTGPAGSVLGLDMDQDKVALATAEAGRQGLRTVEFRVGTVAGWDEPASYDVVYCRFLLQHLSAPIDLLRRMWQALRPGGVIVVEDADFDGMFCDPPSDDFDFCRRMYSRVCALNGGDATIGRKLRRYFTEAGITGPELRLVQAAGSADCNELVLSTLVASAEAITVAGVATAAQVDAAIAGLATLASDPATLTSVPRTFQVWARR
ncbi:MAG: methyltransferase domain-containing protein [Streptosporangiaceae bacterium]